MKAGEFWLSEAEYRRIVGLLNENSEEVWTAIGFRFVASAEVPPGEIWYVSDSGSTRLVNVGEGGAMDKRRLVFRSGSIELGSNKEMVKAKALQAIGHLFVHAGYAIQRAAEDPNSEIPEKFTLEQHVEGWDVSFTLRFDPEPEAK